MVTIGASSVVITRSSILFSLVGSCTCCERPLSAINYSNLLPGAGVGCCSEKPMWGRLKSPMMRHSCYVRRISYSAALNTSPSTAVLQCFGVLELT